MTRLEESDIQDVAEGIAAYDLAEKQRLGFSLAEIACQAIGYHGQSDGYRDGHGYGHKNGRRHGHQNGHGLSLKVAVVPITSGGGLIGGFAQTVQAILAYVGADAFVTEKSDIAGIEEAYRRGAELVFVADDDTCSAFCTTKTVFSDNSVATGAAFAAALELIAQPQKSQPERVLVLGAGPVGRAACAYLRQRNFDVAVFDIDTGKAQAAARDTGCRLEQDGDCLHHYRLILDATTAGGFISADDVRPDTIISAPGVPLCATASAAAKATVYHNPLELGIITMYYDCLSQLAG